MANEPYSAEQSAANDLFEKNKIIDPIPDIPPALLNWDDIKRYVDKVGMISPFQEDNLKPASYGLSLQGKCIYFDEKGVRHEQIVSGDDELEIKSNSIVYITLEPLIQLPDYIAARFNLKIDLVYKGCLLGTGPLVDPGFVGRLSFPLHNLTTNDYILLGGQRLIWMEFTKLSDHDIFHGKSDYKTDDIPGVPFRKFSFAEPDDVWDYMQNAFPKLKSIPLNQSLRSSIPDALDKARADADKAVKSAERLKNWGLVSIIIGFISILTLVVATTFLFLEIRHDIHESELVQRETLEFASKKMEDLGEKAEINRGQIDSLRIIIEKNTKEKSSATKLGKK